MYRSVKGMWDSAGNGMCDVSSCTTLTVCHGHFYVSGVCVSISS